MPRFALLLLAAKLMLFGSMAESHAAKRVALIIGNSAYKHVQVLPNPKNDANAIAAKLRSIGFQSVAVETDLGAEAMRRALSRFGDQADGADTAIVFFAGHGMELGRDNFLIPVDARLKKDRHLQFEAIKLSAVLQAVEGASRLRMVILDACRNNPFAAGMQLSGGVKRSVSRGLARVEPEADILVAFASRHGTTAEDGSGRHSPYTAALLQHMAEPGIDIRLMLGKVRDSVKSATGGGQVPHIYGTLGGSEFHLVPGEKSSGPGNAAALAWAAIENTSNPAVLDAFIKRFPDSFFATLAKVRLDELRKAPEQKVAVGVFPKTPKRAPKGRHRITVQSWGGAYSASQRRAYHQPFMKKYPNIKIVDEGNSASAVEELRKQTASNNVTWDLVDMVPADAIRACDEGLLRSIDADADLNPAPDGTPASRDFYPGVLKPAGTDCFIPSIIWSTTFAYRKDRFARAPSTICDVFDIQSFPGKRALQKTPVNNLEWALICDGVARRDVYDVLSRKSGVDRALRKLNTLKRHVKWWNRGAQSTQMLADGEVTIASGYNGRFFHAITDRKLPLGMIWDHQIWDMDGWVIPKGTKNLDAVLWFVRYASDSQRLADQTKYIAYGPARRSSMPLVGRHADTGVDMKRNVPTGVDYADTAMLTNYLWWADNRAEMNERFISWLNE